MDFELRGCPINKHQLIELISATLAGRKPNVPTYSVCMECKRRGNVCIAVAQGVPCLGPVTHAGCGAICPAFNRGCYGCYGPMESPNTESLTSQFRILGQDDQQIARAFRGFNAWAWQFRKAERGMRTIMSDATRKSRTIKVDYLARVEGEGALFVKLKGDRVTDVKLKIFEPPRLFEAFLRGRHLSEVPDIVARICGICPDRLPDERRARHRARPGRRPSIRQYGSCADSSTAASGSKATPCTSSCSTRPIFSAIRMPSRWLATIAAWSSRACA